MRTQNSATVSGRIPLPPLSTAVELDAGDIAALRADTPGCENVLHLNNAGCGLMARPVLQATIEHLEREAEIGGYEAAAAAAENVREFYAETARLVGAESPANIAFAGSATHAYSKALSAVPFEPGEVILTTRNDFVSNQIAFLALRKRLGVEIVHAPDLPDGAGVDVEAMAVLMRTRRPRLVAVTHVPTNSGLVQPIAEIGRYARELDLLYLVDACQSLGQIPLDVARIGCDMLTATCRKFLRGPRGSGFLYVSERVLAGGYEPQFIDMHGARWTETGDYRPATGAARFEEWEFPYATLLGCAAAARYARRVGIERVSPRAQTLAARLRGRLEQLPGVRVLDRGRDLAALVTFTVERWDPRPFKQAMDRRGINSALSFREFALFDFGDKDIDWCLRLSPHYYNTEDEVDEAASAVAELAGSAA
ncbi:aminotransferase class V-fold PLP-dependent enzyme [Actinospica sp. MGRD01-02]|uniref:Aminotransferase class V-fold PLP-dependent enzyme n=1 Tax=Actinospica acidithermotolerans TaxID=2828514 RepID=A0A941ECB0_9ACTN|nr:aminotransferase class V-fold PLP-dependent enzyme [Actinospica acidithermotolerans]MBR7827842.1 aminotransferase class V-fold PLP-dependent enzyme [Actinospica acidithermotolerans]